MLGKKFPYLVIAVSLTTLPSAPAYAKKTNQAVYEDPFDQAAGGASLTRASQDGILFANPAQLPFASNFIRWIGSQFTLIADRDSIAFAKGMTGGDSEGEGQAEEVIDKVLKDKTPIHAGAATALSFITRNFGLGIFTRFEPDIYGEQFGSSGLPSVHFTMEAYAGGIVSFASKITKWFSLGVTAKYLYVAEPDLEISIADEQKIAQLSSDAEALLDEASFGTGMGGDLGALFFWQGSSVDYRLALKVDDVGGTKFSGSQEPFKQTMHAGMAVTFHGSINSLHLALDYRDIGGVYEEKLFKRLYAGARLILYNHLGIATGFYQGIPSAGLRLDLWAMQLGVTAYGREMGSTVEMRQRNLYVAYFGFGF